MQKPQILPINTPRDSNFQVIFKRQPESITPTIIGKKSDIPRAPSAINSRIEQSQRNHFKQSSQGNLSNCNSNKSSKNSTGFDETQHQHSRISHFHTNTAPVNIQEEMFLLKDQDTGTVYDIRQADIHKANQDYMTKLKKRHKSAWQGWWQQKKENNNQLLYNTKHNNIKEVEKLLEITTKDLQPEINIKDDNGMSSIHYSCVNKNYELSLLLLKNEADCDSINCIGQTPLIICSQNGCDSIITLLLTVGADINCQDNQQNTPLHYACLFQHIKIVEILLARPSIQITLKNIDNKTPLELIQNNNSLKLLIEKFYKMKKDSFNKSHKVQIYEDMLNSSKYYLSNQYQCTKYTDSNRSTLNQSQDEVIGPSSIRIILQIGKGSFGDVYLVERRNQNILQKFKYAMKVLPKNKFIGHNLIRYAMAERNILSYLNHPFIVKLRYAFQTNTHLCLLMDFCPGGDLSKIIQNQKFLPESIAKLFIAEILTALEHLHKNDIIYRDLKPENVVIDQYGHAMLTDFGLSKEGVNDNYGAKSFCGSLAYLAPEMLRRVGHGRAVDWYHLGILLFEMVTGKPPFYSQNREEMLQNIEESKISFPDHISKECKNLIINLLQKNPMKRLGASERDANEVKEHQFFRQINWEDLLKRKYKPPQPKINQEILEQKFDIPFDFILSSEKASSSNYIKGWSFIGQF